MQILAISGAHRESNTEKFLSEFLRGCNASGARAETIKIREKKISPCCGWSDCYYENYCKVRDDMDQIYEKLEKADAWVLATPTYFDNVSSYMKIFIDRLNPYCKPPRYKGKKIFLVVVGGASKKSIAKCLRALKSGFARHAGLDVMGSITAVADHENDILKDEKSLKKAFMTGRRFVALLHSEK